MRSRRHRRRSKSRSTSSRKGPGTTLKTASSAGRIDGDDYFKAIAIDLVDAKGRRPAVAAGAGERSHPPPNREVGLRPTATKALRFFPGWPDSGRSRRAFPPQRKPADVVGPVH